MGPPNPQLQQGPRRAWMETSRLAKHAVFSFGASEGPGVVVIPAKKQLPALQAGLCWSPWQPGGQCRHCEVSLQRKCAHSTGPASLGTPEPQVNSG